MISDHSGKLTIAAVATFVGLIAGGIQIYSNLHKLAEERREIVSKMNGALYDLQVRVCALEGGRWRNGDCRRRR
jgi:hypothetical protein